jgi:hypothetical protein
MEFNANAFNQARGAQILAMYGVYPEQIKKSQDDAKSADDLKKSEEAQALVAKEQEQTQVVDATVTADADIAKGQETQALEGQNTEDDFNKSLEALMAPITFD